MFDSAHQPYDDSSPVDSGLDPSILASFPPEDLALLEWRMRWKATGRKKQHPPEGDWDTWGIMTGRGFGKTLSGAHWVGINAATTAGLFAAVLAPTLDDVRYTNFEGPTGIITIMPPCMIVDYNKSDLLIYLWNGSIIRGFGSEKPARLRGPQHHIAWTDELAAWTYPDECWDMLEFGLRLGEQPKILWTTTPQPIPIIKRLVDGAKADPKRNILVTGSTNENRDNLTRKFYERVARYKGTKIGRQELDGELIDPEESGIVARSSFRLWPADKPLPVFSHVVYSLDTAYTERTFDNKRREPDPSACIVFGLFQYNKLYHVMVLDCWQKWLGFPDLVEQVRGDMRVTYGQIDQPILNDAVIPSRYTRNPIMSGKGIDVLLIEDKGSGISLRQTLAMENIFMEPYNPGRADKLARMHATSPMAAHRRVFLVESDANKGKPKTWYETDVIQDENGEDKSIPGFLPQVCVYHGPGTTQHDDYVDAWTQGMRYFMNKFILTFVTTDNEEERLALHEQEERDRHEHNEYRNPYDL